MTRRLLLLAACLTGCNLLAPAAISDPLQFVSLFQLINKPIGYAGQRVGVTGYAGDPFREHLFISEDHSKIGDISSSVRVHWPDEVPEKCFNKFMRVEGKFGRRNTGEFSIYNIERISTLDESSGLITTCWSS